MYDDIKLKVYDLGGNAKFRSVWTRYFAEIWGFIYVVDAADPERFEESKEQLRQMLEHKMLKGKPFIVVANKQDLPNAVNAEKLKKTFNLKSCKKATFVDASVTTIVDNKCNEGVSNAVSALIGKILTDFEKIGQRRVLDMREQEDIENKERAEKLARLQAKREEEEKAREQNESAHQEQTVDA
ncbi:ADP-ribosylation factor family protein [Tritrichomonas foetus]|uniref:ADP-ribosylation factor family protein n=1 Tax=Tritrichomonas foetus TaxID=1144522 RepID=A0A1J4L131_9EUKA|nr:ADP-ribosylation factor family protein [Tritrichomonas foetus]|eukprot:OHT15670.1 ADP-ribosylation factor family protein [Tritrichomonas foetus]